MCGSGRFGWDMMSYRVTHFGIRLPKQIVYFRTTERWREHESYLWCENKGQSIEISEFNLQIGLDSEK